jgi:ABC-2 type transport system permease protein
MNKLGLIIGREYFSRVKKKSFILTTILTPIGFVAFFVVIILLMTAGTEQKRLIVIDDAGLLGLDSSALASNSQVSFTYNRTYKLEDWKEKYADEDYDGIIYLPEEGAQRIDNITEISEFKVHFYAYQQLGVNASTYVASVLAKRIESIKLRQFGIDEKLLSRANTSVGDIEIKPFISGDSAGQEEEQSSSRIYVATFLGGVMMFLIYFVIVIYGNMVMRSVMEEKTNRIVEIIISSVKPFQLMLGKIIGVGAVGLTQFAIWAVTIPLLNVLVSLLFAGRIAQMQSTAPQQEVSDSDIEMIMGAMEELWSFNYFNIIFFFLLFFLAGYVLYASLFAAIGAAMGDDWGEGQSLTLVVVIPVILAFYVGIAVIEDPNSTLGVFSSLFPLFSPVVMPARVVFDPPLWQILLSLLLLIMTCWLFVWLSGRIYRAGILMYGKKTSLRELVKWMFIKE